MDLFHDKDLEDVMYHARDSKVNEAIELTLLHGTYVFIIIGAWLY